MPQYDTLFAGGEVIDPASGIVGRADVAVRDGKIAAVGENLASADATQVIDATGLYVTPGLIDLHTHIYWGSTYWGIEPDPVAARSGVTAWVDAGSSGAYNFPGFLEHVVKASRSRVFTLLNLSGIGLTAPTWEFANPDYADVELAATTVAENRETIVGIKARIDLNTTRGVGIRPLEQARALADQVDLPLMVHIGSGPPELEAILALLRPGDILTHCFTGGEHRLLLPSGKISPRARELQESGIILDLGHGGGSFNYIVAEAALEDGILPDVLSSDIHQHSVQGPMYDMPTTISKFLNLGMSLEDAIFRSTAAPARAIRHPELGTLALGSVADIALFRLEEGDFVFQDVDLRERHGSKRLISVSTWVNGAKLPSLPERPPAIWARR